MAKVMTKVVSLELFYMIMIELVEFFFFSPFPILIISYSTTLYARVTEIQQPIERVTLII